MRDRDPCPTCGQDRPCACPPHPQPTGAVIPFPARRPPPPGPELPEDPPTPPSAA